VNLKLAVLPIPAGALDIAIEVVHRFERLKPPSLIQSPSVLRDEFGSQETPQNQGSERASSRDQFGTPSFDPKASEL
jgi:hypothetical protein